MSEEPRYKADVTGNEMCEAIARWQKAEFKRDVDPGTMMWLTSFIGERWPVYDLYSEATEAGYGVLEESP